MNPLLLTVALSTLAADIGSISFRGAVIAPTCSYHPVVDTRVVDARDCYLGLTPTVAEPAAQPDPATVALLGMPIPTWRLTYP